MFHRLLPRLVVTLFLIATSALFTPTFAQFSFKSGSSSAGGLVGGGHAGSHTVTTPRVHAELVAHAPQGITPGQPLWLGLQITHQPEWHTYWKNSGDSGLPTELHWSLPPGLDAGDIAWPLPKKIALGNLANYGYEGTVLLPVPVTVASTFAPGPLATEVTIGLRATWLVCNKECIPEDGEFTLRLPVRSSTALHAAAFDAAQLAQPTPLLAGTQGIITDSHARVDLSEGQHLAFSVQGLPVALRGQTLALYPETPDIIDNAAALEQSWNGAVWTARVPLSAHRLGTPSVFPVVLAADTDAGHGASPRQGYRSELKVLGDWPATAPAATISPALEAALRANAATVSGSASPTEPALQVQSASSLTLGAALFGALLGGLLLNLMPCVFPVLAIKVVGFAQHAQDRRAHRISGLAYTAGVVISFVLLGALMLGLRAAGEAVGWGFQLQSPLVVALLAALFTLIALNLAGVFELGHWLPSSVAGLQARHPVADSFLTGVLAVAVASPCTAPFMGASMGLTASLPAPQALSVFVALGLGLALPYLLASWMPAFARALPRPGAWMEQLRRFMAFPMLATVVWLVWVLGQQSGIDGAGALLIVLVGLALLAWALALHGRTRRWLAGAAALVLAALLWAFGPHITALAPATGNTAAQPVGAGWQAWSAEQPAQLMTQGRPVFVDFTAAWCVTCQYNKKTTLARSDVLADFAAKNVALLRADWTRRDPAITAALAELGRSGVPVYVLYAPGRAPQVMTEILSASALRAALQQL